MRKNENKYQADKEFWQAIAGESQRVNTEIRGWMKENAPETWQRYEEWRLAKYLVCQECNAMPCRCNVNVEIPRTSGTNQGGQL